MVLIITIQLLLYYSILIYTKAINNSLLIRINNCTYIYNYEIIYIVDKQIDTLFDLSHCKLFFNNMYVTTFVSTKLVVNLVDLLSTLNSEYKI